MLAVCTKAEAFCASFSRTPPSPPRASARSHAQRSVCGRCGRWPHPMTVLGRNRHFEDATDDLAVFEHVEVVLIPADGRAFEDQPGHRRYPSSSSPASVIQRFDFENLPAADHALDGESDTHQLRQLVGREAVGAHDCLGAALSAAARGRNFGRGIRVLLSWDKPMPGCYRPWFECPVCKRRCQHLYLRSSIACRTCSGLGLHYSSRHVNRMLPETAHLS